MYCCIVFLLVCMPLSGLEQNSVLISTGIWYQMNLVPDLHDTHTRNRAKKNGVDLWRQLLEHVSQVLVYPKNDKKLSYRRETARQLHMYFSAHSRIVHFIEHRICFTTI